MSASIIHSTLMQFVSCYRCGGYADDAAGAVSTTGHGESISKVVNYPDLDSIKSSSMHFQLVLVKVRFFMDYLVLLSWIIAKITFDVKQGGIQRTKKSYQQSNLAPKLLMLSHDLSLTMPLSAAHWS